jgi:hypothetical protein
MNTRIPTIESCDHLPNLVYWPKCTNNAYIGYISLKIWCMMHMWTFYNKGFTLKNEGANIYYVGDGHCFILGIFVCNKNNYRH